MIVNRRQMLSALAAGAASLLIPAGGNAVAQKWNGLTAKAMGKRLIVGSSKHVHFFDVNTLEHLQQVKVGFLPHSFVFHPEVKNEMWTIQRYQGVDKNKVPVRFGSEEYKAVRFRAVGINVDNGDIVGEIVASPGSDFRGHGFFVPGSGLLFISRYDWEAKKSFLTGYDVDLEAERVVRQYNTDMQGIVHYTNENKFIFYGGRIRKFDADMKHHVFGSPDANRAGPYWGSHGIII